MVKFLLKSLTSIGVKPAIDAGFNFSLRVIFFTV